MKRHLPLFLAVVVSTLPAKAEEETANVRLFEWDRGLAVRALAQKEMAVYLWFYEWNMFEAIEPGQHTSRQDLSLPGKQEGLAATVLRGLRERWALQPLG